MIAFGSSDKDFYCFAPNAAAKGYPILHIQMKRTMEGRKEVWVPEIRSRHWEGVHFIGLFETRLDMPKKLVNFSSFYVSAEKPLQTIEIADGLQEFELLHVELPVTKLGPDRFQNLVVLAGTTFGMNLHGLIRSRLDHRPYWERRNQTQRLMNALANYLQKRKK